MSKCRVIGDLGGKQECTPTWCKIAEADRKGFERAQKLAAEIAEHEQHIEPGNGLATQMNIYAAIKQMLFQE